MASDRLVIRTAVVHRKGSIDLEFRIVICVLELIQSFLAVC